MNYRIYILYSIKFNRFYFGLTSNLAHRLIEHNKGESSYTSQSVPWILVWHTKKESLAKELELEFKLKNLSRIGKIEFMKGIDRVNPIQIFWKQYTCR